MKKEQRLSRLSFGADFGAGTGGIEGPANNIQSF